jgi:hypothetical protein
LSGVGSVGVAKLENVFNLVSARLMRGFSLAQALAGRVADWTNPPPGLTHHSASQVGLPLSRFGESSRRVR